MTFEENLDKNTLQEIVDEWKNTFLCGLEPEQTAPVFIVHTDKGRSEIHYIMPRVELTTGKSFNPYFVGRDFKKKDLFQEYINAKYGLSSPRPGLTKSKPKWAKDKKSVLTQLDMELEKLVKSGEIENRTDIVAKLTEWGFEIADDITNKNYIPIVNPDNPEGRAWRLKGAIYKKDFNAINELERISEPAKHRPIEEIKSELDSIIEKNTAYNKRRYPYERRNSLTADRNRAETAPKQQREELNRAITETERDLAKLSKRNDRTAYVRTKRIADKREYGDALSAIITGAKQANREHRSTATADIKSIAERQRQRELGRAVKGSITAVIRELGSDFIRAVKQIVTEVEERFKQPKIESLLDHDLPGDLGGNNFKL
ncbi:MAG: relaxase/mobilization nuclease domain-containing protein [Epsilonproteobacteria bacterium]|nr:relaxase/mobilization nuclease domain-containing protein [Campylobacterota bacterium]